MGSALLCKQIGGAYTSLPWTPGKPEFLNSIPGGAVAAPPAVAAPALSELWDLTDALEPKVAARNARHSDDPIRLLAKAEFLDPASQSHKDRIARAIIGESIWRGDLTSKRGGKKTIVAASSGNTSAAMANSGTDMGYDVTIITNKLCSEEICDNIVNGGAKLWMVEELPNLFPDILAGVKYYMDQERVLCEHHSDEYFLVNQYENVDNVDDNFFTFAFFAIWIFYLLGKAFYCFLLGNVVFEQRKMEARERQLDANPTASEFDLRREESKQTSSNGDVYGGGRKEHMRCGQGEQISANGDVYEGGWKDNNRCGQGKYTSANGQVYEGEWRESKRHGQGKYTDLDGDVYEGGWLENKRHGEGKYTFANGQVCEGQWLNDELLELIQVLVVNRDTGNITKHTCSSAKTLGCFLDRSTKDHRYNTYFRVVHKERSLFLSSSGKKTLRSLGINNGDEIEIGGICLSDNKISSVSPKNTKKASKSKTQAKMRQKKPERPKKQPGSPFLYVVNDDKQEHSKSMNPVLEELGRKLKKRRNRLNSLATKKSAPKEKHFKPKKSNVPEAATPYVSIDQHCAKRAGKVAYPILVGEVSNLYSTSKLLPGHLITIDLHGCSKAQALSKLDNSLPLWVDAAMRGSDPWVLGVDIVCGGGSQTLSGAVRKWIRINRQVANRPKGLV